MSRLFADQGIVRDLEIERRQRIESLLTNGLGELFPCQPRTEE
jgi:hypothetical protein